MEQYPIKKRAHRIRMVTAASLFDGHDVSINIMRRVLQDHGAEVIHLGHNRSVLDVVTTALQEGAQGICISSYQGGHMEYFKYMKDLLKGAGADHIKIFGGGGGVIVHSEKKELEAYGIDQIFHPEDGRKLGLEGMIEYILDLCDFSVSDIKHTPVKDLPSELLKGGIPHRDLGLMLSQIESKVDIKATDCVPAGFARTRKASPLVVGVTGTGGAGKSSLVDELVQRFLNVYPDFKIGVFCVDPSKRKTGGALLGDRIRMNSLSRPGTFMRSIASRGSGNEIAPSLLKMIEAAREMQFDLIIAETSGIGQASSAITEVSDVSLYVMTSEFGAQSQLEKIDMIDYADLIAINKADHRGSLDAHRDVIKQYKRSRKLFEAKDSDCPVFLTQASQFNDLGVNHLFLGLCKVLETKDSDKGANWGRFKEHKELTSGVKKTAIVPPERQAYMAEVTSVVRKYKKRTQELVDVADQIDGLEKSLKIVADDNAKKALQKSLDEIKSKGSKDELNLLEQFPKLKEAYSGETLVYEVRGKKISQPLTKESLSHVQIPKVCLPDYSGKGDQVKFLRLENVPGQFPFTAGVFPLKRDDEDPIRMFAGEGPAEKTNKRFHFLSEGMDTIRLSTAFDSVTLYGQEPDPRPDIYGKVGESGVSIASLEDMKRLYSGFDLCDPKTSVSMTINGPAPMILAFFMNTAIDQSIEKKEKELGRKLNEKEVDEVSKTTLQTVRGTVQADILKEDQGQNTCIFSIDFALKMMGDIQEYFIKNQIRNFYSVSISGYHIAEAGANPITQLALTLSNAFTFVEYYASRGMKIDDFAQNLSFFFSNGLDPEYTVLGRVARRIWAIAMRDLYKGSERSQKLKYHIQTSGRSLHAQEIAFNDIRTTLQAFLAIADNCNSLHTNAFDEAITTPTEESVRRAQAIQMIINREYGMSKNENPLQGSYFTSWLTDKVEEAVLEEFLSINERGGVLGAMETQYQRGKIQEESLYYETLKHNGQLPIVGVNTFIDPTSLKKDYVPPTIELRRSTPEEKKLCLDRTSQYQKDHSTRAKEEINKLKLAALNGDNVFAALMSASRWCTLYQMSQALYEVGGQYRRNI